MKRDALQHLAAGFFECCVKFEEGFAKSVDLVRPDIGWHIFRKIMALRQLATDVPEFLEVMDLGILGLFGPERRVSASPAATRRVIRLLHIIGEREEFLGQRLGAIDQVLRDTVIADDRETVLLEAAAQLIGYAVQRLCQRHYRDIGIRIGHGEAL